MLRQLTDQFAVSEKSPYVCICKAIKKLHKSKENYIFEKPNQNLKLQTYANTKKRIKF
jgi:hypothetical protein